MSISSIGSPDFFIDPQTTVGRPPVYRIKDPLVPTMALKVNNNRLFVIEMIVDSPKEAPTKRQVVMRPIEFLVETEKALHSLWLEKHVGVVFYRKEAELCLMRTHEDNAKLFHELGGRKIGVELIGHYQGSQGGLFIHLGGKQERLDTRTMSDAEYRKLYTMAPTSCDVGLSIRDIFTDTLARMEADKKKKVEAPAEGSRLILPARVQSPVHSGDRKPTPPASPPPSPDIKPIQSPPSPEGSPLSSKNKDERNKKKDKCIVM